MNSSATKCVLYVGSDPPEADKLERQSSWQVRVAANAAEALNELARDGTITTVIANSSLSGTSAKTFLAEIGERFPHLARLALSSSDKDAPSAKPFNVIPKRCDTVLLLGMLDRTYNLQRLVSGDAVRRIAGPVDKLPSVPQTYWDLVKAAESETSGAQDFARIVSADASTSLKVLQLANSAFFGSAQRITSVQHAVTRLGIELLKGLVLSANVFTTVDVSAAEGFSLEYFQRYSLQIARLAKQFLSPTHAPLADEAFTSAILHNIGTLVLAMREPARFSEVTARMAETSERDIDVEREVFGASHAEVGAYLLSTWGIPISIVETAAYHHCPSVITAGSVEVLAAVHAADALFGIACGDPEDRLDRPFLDRAGFGAQIPTWRDLAEAELNA